VPWTTNSLMVAAAFCSPARNSLHRGQMAIGRVGQPLQASRLLGVGDDGGHLALRGDAALELRDHRRRETHDRTMMVSTTRAS